MDWNKISSILINSLAQIQQPIEELSFDDVRELYGTGRSYQTEKRRHDDKGYTYRHGIQTKIGDIEISVWYELVERMIRLKRQEELYNQLLIWVEEEVVWFKTKEEAKGYALKLHASQIFDNPKWVDYIPFNKRFRPNRIEETIE